MASTPPGRTEAGEAELSTLSQPLFPLFPIAADEASTAHVPAPLSSSTFSFDASSLPAPSASALPASPGSDSDGGSAGAPVPQSRSYDLLPSSPSSRSDSGDKRRSTRRERKRKKRKRPREKEGEDFGDLGKRKSGVRAWVGSDTKPVKDYYFDDQGDRDNLVYGSIYSGDVAKYRPSSTSEFSQTSLKLVHGWRHLASNLGEDSDRDGMDRQAKMAGRYYSIKYAALERDKGFKHLKFHSKNIPSFDAEQFVPLEEPPHTEKAGSVPQDLEESWEDELIRKTREFNKMSRDFPHDEKVWLAFAEFQDKIMSSQPQKAARLQTLERKISILEKAVELNPDNEELLLSMLKSYRQRDSTEQLLGRWEKILIQHSDSCRLWKEFLLFCQGEFSQFKVSEMRKNYTYAIQALSSACAKLLRQDSGNSHNPSKSLQLAQLEIGLVDIFVTLCRFEWQTGHHELATGLFQAEMEYSLFSPSLDLTMNSKRRLFEHFWNSGASRIGEDGALGWCIWLAKDDEKRKNIFMQEKAEEMLSGGWSGWSGPSLKNDETDKEHTESTPNDENEKDNPDAEATQTDEDIEALLRKLGIDVDAESNTEVKDAKTWNKWSTEELSRDDEQWLPVNEYSASLNDTAREGDEQLSRIILFDDVSDYLFSLSCEESRFSLMCQFIDFFGGRLPKWTSTNSSTWLDKILSFETIPEHILEDMRVASDLIKNMKTNSICTGMDSLFGNSCDFSKRVEMMKFLRNAIMLSLDIFPRNHILEEVLLVTEELAQSPMGSSYSVNSSRALAKRLLKKDRQDFLLCGVYARREAAHGNIELARKIFDMAITSVDGASKDLQEKAPLLYFWYAEVEMKASTLDIYSEQSRQRAMHILYCLGSSAKYTPFEIPVSGPQILRARQGFREKIRSSRHSWSVGSIEECSVSLVLSASLFEAMTSNWTAGINVIEDTFSTTHREIRSQSADLESLWVYYLALLLDHIKFVRFSSIWENVSDGMETYPYNSKSYSAVLALSSQYSVSNKVRLLFDKYCQRYPSSIVWFYALSFEWNKAESRNRVHVLFEKALANDRLQKSVLLWRCYLAYEIDIACNPLAARRIFFRAIHSCPWSKRLWLDGFQKLSSILTLKELSDLESVMRDKELHIRTDVFEILLQDETS